MTTDKAFADRLIAGNGLLPECGDEGPDNPPAGMIVEFTNMAGKLAYGVTFKGEDTLKYMRPSEFIRNPRVYWQSTVAASRTIDMRSFANGLLRRQFREEEIGGVVDAAGNVSSDAEGGL